MVLGLIMTDCAVAVFAREDPKLNLGIEVRDLVRLLPKWVACFSPKAKPRSPNI